jgi:hypothetical protein
VSAGVGPEVPFMPTRGGAGLPPRSSPCGANKTGEGFPGFGGPPSASSSAPAATKPFSGLTDHMPKEVRE